MRIARLRLEEEDIREEERRGKRKMKGIILILSIILINIIYYILLIYNRNYIELQNRIEIIEYIIGLDGINILIIGLIISIFPIILLIDNKRIKDYIIKIGVIGLIIILLLIQDLLPFYISYELVVIPLYYIVTKEGSKYKKYLYRNEAGIRLIIMTLLGGIWLLIGVIIIRNKYGTTNNEIINYLINNESSSSLHLLLSSFFLLSFFIKIPVFPFHTWLPLAHSDAPTYGSIILAGIILKLATYGIIRYNLGLFPSLSSSLNLAYSPSPEAMGGEVGIEEGGSNWGWYTILLILSLLYYSILPLRGVFDLKKIIAYSSIVHMSIATLGLLSKDSSGILGGIIIMITHGWISTGLFYLIGIIYKRYKTRYINYYQGLSIVLPIWTILLILFILGNISLPITYSFFGEIFILSSYLQFNLFILFSIFFALFFSSLFSIYFMSRILFGPLSPMINYTIPNNSMNSINNLVKGVDNIRDNEHLGDIEKKIGRGYKDLTIKEVILILPICAITYLITLKPNIIIGIVLLPTYLLS